MILLVGGAGYIGSHVNKMLNREGYETVVFDNLSYGHRDFVKWGTFFLGDLCNIENIRACFREYRIDAVMHFASFTYVGESVADPAKYYRNNLVSALNLLDVMREFCVMNFIFSSSCSTYGNPQYIPLTEDHPQNPINPYGRTKLMIEQVLQDYDWAYGIKHINLRYFNAAGADPDSEIGERHDPEFSLIPLAIYAALGINDNIKVFGTDYPTHDGTCIRDYIHVTDLADAHVKSLDYVKNGRKSQSFNLGNNQGYSVREVINTVRKVSGSELTVVEAPRRSGDPAVLIGSCTKARETLNWNPRYGDITTIIETAWNWHRRDFNR